MTDIHELMERIVATTPKGVVPQFTFVLIYEQATQPQEVKNMFGLDDAIAFLFDRDMFLWKVKKVEFSNPAIPQLDFLSRWRITLKKEGNKQ